MSLKRCDVDERSLKFWKDSFANCVEAQKKTHENCCAELACTNPQIISKKCPPTEDPDSPHFGDLRYEGYGVSLPPSVWGIL